VREQHGAPVMMCMMLVIATALHLPLTEAACTTGNKFSNVGCATMFCAKKLISLYFLQSGTKTRFVRHENTATDKV
jgi:hypothetical protein